MKKIKVILFSLFAFTMIVGTSCVKEKNCSNCMTGKWIYFEEPLSSMDGEKVVAYFYPDDEVATIMSFGGKVPKKYQSMDTMNVCLTYKDPGYILFFDMQKPLKLSCIEELK